MSAIKFYQYDADNECIYGLDENGKPFTLITNKKPAANPSTNMLQTETDSKTRKSGKNKTDLDDEKSEHSKKPKTKQSSMDASNDPINNNKKVNNNVSSNAVSSQDDINKISSKISSLKI